MISMQIFCKLIPLYVITFRLGIELETLFKRIENQLATYNLQSKLFINYTAKMVIEFLRGGWWMNFPAFTFNKIFFII